MGSRGDLVPLPQAPFHVGGSPQEDLGYGFPSGSWWCAATAVLGNHVAFAVFPRRSGRVSLPPCCDKHCQGLMAITGPQNLCTLRLPFALQWWEADSAPQGTSVAACATLPAWDAEEARSLASSPSRPLRGTRGEGNKLKSQSRGSPEGNTEWAVVEKHA